MRRLVFTLALACAFIACSSSRYEEPSPTSKMADIVGRLDELEERARRLQAEADRFDSEDWREVVPDVRDEIDALAAEIDELQTSAFSLEQDLIRAEDPGDYEPPEDPRR